MLGYVEVGVRFMLGDGMGQQYERRSVKQSITYML